MPSCLICHKKITWKQTLFNHLCDDPKCAQALAQKRQLSAEESEKMLAESEREDRESAQEDSEGDGLMSEGDIMFPPEDDSEE